jgi:DNA-binding MarR family transcriptional regulator
MQSLIFRNGIFSIEKIVQCVDGGPPDRMGMMKKELMSLSDESPPSLFSNQVDEFIREMTFLHENLISFKHSMEAGLSDEYKTLKKRLESICPSDSTKQSDDYDLMFKICRTLITSKAPPTMGEMSAALGITLSAATRLVAWLVDNDYAARISDPQDRRMVRVTLTDKGFKVFQTLNDIIAHRAGQILNRFTEEERILLILLLRKLAKSL